MLGRGGPRRQRADDLAGAVRAPLPRQAPRLRRERWDTPDGDFIDVDFLDRAPAADAPWLVLFHGLEGSSRSHYAQAFADWARATAGRSPCRTFAAARASSTARRAPTTRATTKKSAGSSSACGRCSARPLVGGRRFARRQRVAALGRGGRRQRVARRALRGRRLVADRPRRRRPCDRARLQPAGLHAACSCHDAPEGAAQARPAPGPVRSRRRCSPRATCTVRQPLHRAAARLSRHRGLLVARLGQAAPAPDPHSGARAQRAQRPFRSGREPAAQRTRSAPTSRCGSRPKAGTSGFPRAGPGACVHAARGGDGLGGRAQSARRHARSPDH